jgi:hypothetical protein
MGWDVIWKPAPRKGETLHMGKRKLDLGLWGVVLYRWTGRAGAAPPRCAQRSGGTGVLRAILETSMQDRREGLLAGCANKRRPARRPGGQRPGKEAGSARWPAVGRMPGHQGARARPLSKVTFGGAGGHLLQSSRPPQCGEGLAAKGSEQQRRRMRARTCWCSNATRSACHLGSRGTHAIGRGGGKGLVRPRRCPFARRRNAVSPPGECLPARELGARAPTEPAASRPPWTRRR